MASKALAELLSGWNPSGISEARSGNDSSHTRITAERVCGEATDVSQIGQDVPFLGGSTSCDVVAGDERSAWAFWLR